MIDNRTIEDFHTWEEWRSIQQCVPGDNETAIKMYHADIKYKRWPRAGT